MQDKAVREQERKQYYQKRGADHKQLMQRTSKGQPVMAGQIAHLLAKLEKMRK